MAQIPRNTSKPDLTRWQSSGKLFNLACPRSSVQVVCDRGYASCLHLDLNVLKLRVVSMPCPHTQRRTQLTSVPTPSAPAATPSVSSFPPSGAPSLTCNHASAVAKSRRPTHRRNAVHPSLHVGLRARQNAQHVGTHRRELVRRGGESGQEITAAQGAMLQTIETDFGVGIEECVARCRVCCWMHGL